MKILLSESEVKNNDAIIKMLINHFNYSIADITDYQYLTKDEKSFIDEKLFNAITSRSYDGYEIFKIDFDSESMIVMSNSSLDAVRIAKNNGCDRLVRNIDVMTVDDMIDMVDSIEVVFDKDTIDKNFISDYFTTKFYGLEANVVNNKFTIALR